MIRIENQKVWRLPVTRRARFQAPRHGAQAVALFARPIGHASYFSQTQPSRIQAEVENQKIVVFEQVIHTVRGNRGGHLLKLLAESHFGDAPSSEIEHSGIISNVGKARAPRWINRQIRGQEWEYVLGLIVNKIPRVVRI